MGISCFWCVLLYLPLFLTPPPILVTALPDGYLPVNSSVSWTNSLTAPNSVKFNDGSFVKIILASGFSDLSGEYCGCGFFYNQTYNISLFAIFTLYYEEGNISKSKGPEVVWSAKPKNPISVNAALQLTSERGLVLQDADGTMAWSTNISNKSVAGVNLTNMCNLMLLDENNATIWQSFDHPTDTLIVGQKLVSGQNLTSSEGGLFTLSLTSQGLFAYINSNPPQSYFSFIQHNISYAQFQNGSLALIRVDEASDSPSFTFYLSLLSSTYSPNRYMRFGPDGHLRVYNTYWGEMDDFLTRRFIDSCGYPMVCGNYSICSNGQCNCPAAKNGINYFHQIEDRQPDRGCSLVTPLSCEASQNHVLFELENITYFPFRKYPPTVDPDHRHINLDGCKQACLKDCSCKAAIYNSSNHVGNCYLQSQIYSLIADDKKDTELKVYIKVQNVPSDEKKKHPTEIILGSSITSFFVLFLLIGIFVFLFWKKENVDEGEEYYLDHVPGMPTRYSYDDLQAMTENFNKELGAGGFGTVFEGTLIDGTKVAVKRLDGLSQIKKSFLAEVETIGSIHHFNLVRLIGFCAEKFHRLLVYEYMSNGSLDRWVFHKNPEILLDWKHRKKVILDIARGLTYLHEDCRQKIVHLDIKPQNILLDEKFNAKVSDFGLSKLVDRDQSEVVTTIRGTPGYMAPEWSSSVITEKVDVYSFGVMLLEILCGRRNFDRSQPEEAMNLLELFKKMIEENQLLDLVDKYNEDMQLHGPEVVNMMRVAARCLQNDYTKRPSMSMVVKIIEDNVNVESDLDYFFWNPPLPNMGYGVDNQEVYVASATSLLPSILSGPR
jgi:hypothetical protein